MSRVSLRLFCVLALAVAVGLAAAVSPHASSAPDGLERVAGDKGFLDKGFLDKGFLDKGTLHEDPPMPGYAFPGISDQRVATGVAGFAGSLGVFALGYGLALGIRRRRAAATGGRAWARSS